MRIGVPRERKDQEYRVGITPAGVMQLVQAGHQVLIEAGAGEGSGFADEEYRRRGAHIVRDPSEVWGCDLVMKVKEPLSEEYRYLREGLVLFAFLHLAADAPLTQALVASRAVAIAYETVQLPDGELPLLTPMSEVAGKLAVQEAAYHLKRTQGGKGTLLGGVTGVAPGTVVILGGGVVGTNAARVALGMGAQVTILERNFRRMLFLDDVLHGRFQVLTSNPYTIEQAVAYADVLVGAVLVPGARTPRLVTEEMVKAMKPGSVIVDVSIDQGGCIEGIRPTTHSDPVYVRHGVMHYAVTNMPAAVPRTSTVALTNVTVPYALEIAAKGWQQACREDPALRRGLNVVKGTITHPGVAEAHGLPYAPAEEILGGSR
ncbi:MAG: alanine dehydrogenase [Armatimonadota bacterium]|nr:alanine dehydrogenase [Armatimonadota bacterium]MDR7439588.1 alanine dehydrogenase [Armatimonadota bacterium]MDR7562733.1 alanine dehydrogenase [Armatimonadota bacterium]MDR7568380.1 alanine dehydrogenase [Armatimonadota bacterium]MDR7601032.1 alanine dehydrogenase [Armatimonadota bacterium]